MSDLHTFEGRDVVATGVAIKNAGDGLSKALAIEPDELAIGEKVFVVLECVVSKIHHEAISDTDALRRVHDLRAGTATFVDEALVADVLEQQRVALERAQGVQRLPVDDA